MSNVKVPLDWRIFESQFAVADEYLQSYSDKDMIEFVLNNMKRSREILLKAQMEAEGYVIVDSVVWTRKRSEPMAMELFMMTAYGMPK